MPGIYPSYAMFEIYWRWNELVATLNFRNSIFPHFDVFVFVAHKVNSMPTEETSLLYYLFFRPHLT